MYVCHLGMGSPCLPGASAPNCAWKAAAVAALPAATVHTSRIEGRIFEAGERKRGKETNGLAFAEVGLMVLILVIMKFNRCCVPWVPMETLPVVTVSTT